MRISDWSSDVCSSDLQDRQPAAREDAVDGRARVGGEPGRRIRLPRIAQVNQMVRNVGALAGGRLCRADVEHAVYQSRIDADDLPVQEARPVQVARTSVAKGSGRETNGQLEYSTVVAIILKKKH